MTNCQPRNLSIYFLARDDPMKQRFLFGSLTNESIPWQALSGEDPGLVAGYHGQTLPWPVPQEQDAQGEADEDPKEPKVNCVHISY